MSFLLVRIRLLAARWQVAKIRLGLQWCFLSEGRLREQPNGGNQWSAFRDSMVVSFTLMQS